MPDTTSLQFFRKPVSKERNLCFYRALYECLKQANAKGYFSKYTRSNDETNVKNLKEALLARLKTNQSALDPAAFPNAMATEMVIVEAAQLFMVKIVVLEVNHPQRKLPLSIHRFNPQAYTNGEMTAERCIVMTNTGNIHFDAILPNRQDNLLEAGEEESRLCWKIACRLLEEDPNDEMKQNVLASAVFHDGDLDEFVAAKKAKERRKQELNQARADEDVRHFEVLKAQKALEAHHVDPELKGEEHAVAVATHQSLEGYLDSCKIRLAETASLCAYLKQQM